MKILLLIALSLALALLICYGTLRWAEQIARNETQKFEEVQP